MDWEDQRALDREAATNPQPGDYWHEMFCGAYVVLAVTPETVTVCDTKVDTDRDHWTWDITKTRKLLREDFRKELCYSSEAMKDTMWCNVVRGGKSIAFVNAFNELQNA